MVWAGISKLHGDIQKLGLDVRRTLEKIWANCPAMTAIVEAVCYLGVPLDRIDVLSIGTTEEPFTVKSMAQAGWVRWGKTLIDLLMNAQVDSSVRHAQLLVGEPRFLRVNTVTTPGMYALDGSKEIEDLVTLGNRKGADPEILNQVKSRFLNGISAMDWKLNGQRQRRIQRSR